MEERERAKKKAKDSTKEEEDGEVTHSEQVEEANCIVSTSELLMGVWRVTSPLETVDIRSGLYCTQASDIPGTR